MATINPTYNVLQDSLVSVTWANMTTGDIAGAHYVRGKPALTTVQAEGTFNSTRIGLTGSLSNVAYIPATDMTQTAISFTANGAVGVLEPYVYWKPTISSGSSDNVTITLSYWVH